MVEKNETPADGFIRIDGLGRKVRIPANPRRCMALAPSETEMLFALIPDSQVISVTPNCNFPPEKVAGKRKTEVYPLDFEGVIALKPDLVFSEEGMISLDDAAHLEKLGISLFVFRFRKSAEVLEAMDSISVWLHAGEKAGKLMDSLHRGLAKLESELATQKRPIDKVLVITYIDPIFGYGNDTWMTDKIRLAGGINVLNETLDKPYPVLQRETVLKLNPDVLFGASFEKMDTTFFRMYPELKRIKAYRNKRVFELTDDLASRPGPRILEGIEEIKVFLEGKNQGQLGSQK